MSITSSTGSIESTPVVTEPGTNGPLAFDPVTIPDDMLYEVVNGKVVEKIVGAYEVDIAGILNPLFEDDPE